MKKDILLMLKIIIINQYTDVLERTAVCTDHVKRPSELGLNKTIANLWDRSSVAQFLRSAQFHTRKELINKTTCQCIIQTASE